MTADSSHAPGAPRAEGAHAAVAFAEGFLREPQRTLIPEAEWARAALSMVQVSAIRFRTR